MVVPKLIGRYGNENYYLAVSSTFMFILALVTDSVTGSTSSLPSPSASCRIRIMCFWNISALVVLASTSTRLSRGEYVNIRIVVGLDKISNCTVKFCVQSVTFVVFW